MLHTVLVVIVVVGIVGYVIGRQLLGEPLRGKRVVLLPLIVAVVGAVDLARNGDHPQGIDVVFIVISCVLSAGIGVGQGALMRLEERDGGLWGQLPPKGLWLWATLVVTHVAVDIGASTAGAHVAASSAPLLLVLGVNRVAQAAAIAPRALRAGVAFAPEKDGSTFLGGVMGSATTPNARSAAVPGEPDPTAQPQTATSWTATGQNLASALGDALQDRRAARRRDDRRGRRGERGRRDR